MKFSYGEKKSTNLVNNSYQLSKLILIVGLIVYGVLVRANSTNIGPSKCGTLYSALTSSPRPELPPKNTGIIALGVDIKTENAKSGLEQFAQVMGDRLDRNVVTYKKFTDAGYLSSKGVWWERSPETTTSQVEKAVRAAVEKSPGKKVIVFNLDGFNPAKLFNQKGGEHFSYTNFEVRLLFSDQKLFEATTWYHKGKELTQDEVKQFFGDHISLPK